MEVVIRVAFVYAFLLVALRIMGKREFGQLAPFDLLVLMLIPELFQQAMVGEDRSMTTAVVGACTLLGLVFLASVLAYRSRTASQVLESEPTVLVQDGQFIRPALDRERVSADEVLAAMRSAGHDRLEDVRWGILETSGNITIVPAVTPGGAGGAKRDVA